MPASLKKLLSYIDAPKYTKAGLKAPWLKSRWTSPVWIITWTIGRRTRTSTINWRAILPDGKRLTDAVYADQLETIRYITFISRASGQIENAKCQSRLAEELINLLRYSIKRQKPRRNSTARFSQLTPQHYIQFLEKVRRGTFGALDIEAEIRTVVSDLRASGTLDQIVSDGTLNLSELASRINASPTSLSRYRQLRPLLHDLGLEYKSSAVETKHFKDYRRREDHDGLASHTSIESVLTAWEHLWESTEHCPDSLTFDPMEISISPSKQARKLARPKGRTPTIPEEIALHNLHWAIRFVTEYGEALISYYHDAMDKVASLTGQGVKRLDHYGPQAFRLVRQPRCLRPLKINRLQGRETKHPRPTSKDDLSIIDAVRLLIAACFLTIGIFSSRRVEEILALEPDAVQGDVGAFVLRFYLEKGTDFGPIQALSRPIPDVAGQAVTLLAKLCGDTADKSETVFSFDTRLGRLMRRETIQRVLDMFGDYIESPLIPEAGQVYRWYVRPHELRRFFAMSFFWANPDASLDALSWFLGHLDRDRTITYLTEAVSGRVFLKYHVNFVQKSLVDKTGRIENRDALTAAITSRFKVQDVSLVQAESLNTFLSVLSQKNAFDVKVTDCPSGTCGDSILVTFKEPIRGTTS